MDPITAAREALASCGEESRMVHRDHLRAALARADELTAEVERLRVAGMTVTRGTECHITRGRDV